MLLLGTGVSIPFMRPRYGMLIGLAFPPLGFTCLVLYVWGYIILNAILNGAFFLVMQHGTSQNLERRAAAIS